MKGLIGILGGMGPAATVDIFNKFVAFTSATKDQDHIPLLISSIPDIPDRSSALLHNGKTPLQHLQRYLRMLEDSGAECIIIPCNTAHYWLPELKKKAKAHTISIIDSALDEVMQKGQRKVGILATDATLAAGLYQKKMAQLGIECLKPDSGSQPKVMQSIYLLKAGRQEEARALMNKAAADLLARGAEAIICGCTEVPIILEQRIAATPEHYVDATSALVRASIKWYQQRIK